MISSLLRSVKPAGQARNCSVGRSVGAGLSLCFAIVPPASLHTSALNSASCANYCRSCFFGISSATKPIPSVGIAPKANASALDTIPSSKLNQALQPSNPHQAPHRPCRGPRRHHRPILLLLKATCQRFTSHMARRSRPTHVRQPQEMSTLTTPLPSIQRSRELGRHNLMVSTIPLRRAQTYDQEVRTTLSPGFTLSVRCKKSPPRILSLLHAYTLVSPLSLSIISTQPLHGQS